jgi:preprotein translocase subunit SecG
MKLVLYTVNISSALLMIGIILLQQGKGAEMGSGFGRGSSGSLFGARGSANFLTRVTSVLATVFFLSAFMLTFLANKRADDGIIRGLEEGAQVQPVDAETKADADSGIEPVLEPPAKSVNTEQIPE